MDSREQQLMIYKCCSERFLSITSSGMNSRASHPSILRLCSPVTFISSDTSETFVLLKEDSSCSASWLDQLLEGRSASSPMFGVMCNEDSAPPVLGNEDSVAPSYLKTLSYSENEAILLSLMN